MKERNKVLDDRVLVDPRVPICEEGLKDCITLARDCAMRDERSWGVYYLNRGEGRLGLLTHWYARSLGLVPQGATKFLSYDCEGKVWYEPAVPPTLVLDMLTCCIDCYKNGAFIQMNRDASGWGWLCPSCGKRVKR